ncbi:type 1 glutamine amidotransferase domain-containing protein [Rhodospirillaceae bacterium SYSU D60014]|uniref:type 1 glutamine amidotransferase domain-containing protein n=1 Tax=Virgifigura deserti TaxID=2268457 RepID=UPI000E66FC2D
MPKLDGKKVAILATDGFEQSELTEPKKRLEQEGATTQVIAPKTGQIRGWNHTDWGDSVDVDVPLDSAQIGDYDALVLPGGVINPDKLRTVDRAVSFVREFFQSGKPVAAICHGPWMLVEAGVIRGCRATSYHSIRTDMKNAGADWVDQEVVTDKGLVTSRSPDDLEAFCRKLVEEIAEGKHEQRKVA